MALKRVPCNAWWTETSAHVPERSGIGLPVVVMRILLGGPLKMDERNHGTNG